MKLALSKLRRDGGTQSRDGLNATTVANYADAMRGGEVFPPILVVHDGKTYWLVDGFHRVEAAERAELSELEATIRQGNRRDAILFSVGANGSHGLPRSAADKERAVRMLLDDEEWSLWSDRRIAATVKVAHSFVAKIRRSVGTELGESGLESTSPDSESAAATSRTIAKSIARVERRCLKVRDEVRALCVDAKVRGILEDTLLDLAKDFYAISDGSAYAAGGPLANGNAEEVHP